MRRRLGRCALGALLLLTAASTPAAVAAPAPAACPAPKTCPDYVLAKDRWPAAADGRVAIAYKINATGTPTMTEPEFIGAVAAATAVWERANPRIDFHYDGTTVLLPGIPDGTNVIGFGVVPPPGTGLFPGAAEIFSTDGRITEADIVLDPVRPWRWEQCPQRDGACGAEMRPVVALGTDFTGEIARVPGSDVQAILTHELGHWLSLLHPDTSRGSLLTMHGAGGARGMSRQTLGLGDVLGVRAAYPCGKCGGKPLVFAP